METSEKVVKVETRLLEVVQRVARLEVGHDPLEAFFDWPIWR